MEHIVEPNALSWIWIVWLAGCFLFSKVTGWSELGVRYRFRGQFRGRRFPMQSVRMRWMMNYSNCVTLGANASGLYVAMLILFRPFHPTLLIPWAELTVSTVTDPFGLRFVVFQPKAVPQVTLAVSAQLAGELCAQAPGTRAKVSSPEEESRRAESAVPMSPQSSGRVSEPSLERPTETLEESERRRKAEMKAHLDRILDATKH